MKLPYEFTAARNELVLYGHHFNDEKKDSLTAFLDDRFQRMFARDGYEQDPGMRDWAFQWMLRVVEHRKIRALDAVWTGDTPSLANHIKRRPKRNEKEGWPAPCQDKMEEDLLIDMARLQWWYMYLYEVECEVVLQMREYELRFMDVSTGVNAGGEAQEDEHASARCAANEWEDVTLDLGHMSLLWAEYMPSPVSKKMWALMFDPSLRKGEC